MPGIQHPGSTGVIYCSDRAMANGFNYASSHEWSNLGQGAPEAGPIPNAPARPTSIDVPLDSLEYAPTTGVKSESLPVLVLGHGLSLYDVMLMYPRLLDRAPRGGGKPVQPHLPPGQE